LQLLQLCWMPPKRKVGCKGRHIPMAKLDELIIENVKGRLLAPERLTNILEALVDRQDEMDSAIQGRRAALEAELVQINDRLKRLYRAIEDGIVELDAQLKDRIQTLKTEQDITRISLER